MKIFTPTETPCTRCYHCCIETNGKHNRTLEAGLALQWQVLLKNPEIRMCPLLAVADDALPICLIHEDKPSVCRQYHCLTIKSPSHLLTKK